MATTAAAAACSFLRLPSPSTLPRKPSTHPPLISIIFPLHSQSPFPLSPLRSSRRISNYTQEGGLITGPRNWGASGFDFEDDDDSSDEDDDDDRSLDLIVRFVQNVFRKISRRVRKAVRSVLPVMISPRLVRFSVNGVLMLASLWIAKAFLEVVCNLGTVVFVTILLIRVIWSGMSYFQHNRSAMLNRVDDENSAWTGAQPVT